MRPYHFIVHRAAHGNFLSLHPPARRKMQKAVVKGSVLYRVELMYSVKNILAGFLCGRNLLRIIVVNYMFAIIQMVWVHVDVFLGNLNV